MELIYLHHSGFVILMNNSTIVIDYFEDSFSKKNGILQYTKKKWQDVCTFKPFPRRSFQ